MQAESPTFVVVMLALLRSPKASMVHEAPKHV